MITIYYLLFALLLLVAGPFLLTAKKARAGLSQKLGFITPELKNAVQKSGSTPRIWFHAVSVGEFNALSPLLEKFKQKYPSFKIFVSTTTATGQELAKSKAEKYSAEVFYFPFDLPWITQAYLDLIKPSLVGIIETEIWPGFINQCKERSIPCLILNGRLSPKSAKGYLRWSVFFGPVLRQLSGFAVQSEQEKERFEAIAGTNLNLQICGNIKLDGLKAIAPEEIAKLRSELNLNEDEFVLVAGSTHEGEETALMQAASKNGCRLILVPRHPERFDRVAQLIQESGATVRRFSKKETLSGQNDIYLLDTIGQLNRFYGLADLAFVGGTLANIGGHNLAEPCIYKVPVLCGPHIHKAKELFCKLSEKDALKLANDVEELSNLVHYFKESASERHRVGNNGYRFVQDSQGAVERTLSMLEQYLPTDNSAKGENCLSGVGARGR